MFTQDFDQVMLPPKSHIFARRTAKDEARSAERAKQR
jgi:hypothetical protein